MDQRYKALQDILNADSEYQELRQELIRADVQLQKLLRSMEPVEKEILYEYLGALAELQMREIELALTER